MPISDRIKACRNNAKMSQEKLAELMGVSRQAVTKWEAGQSAPSTENLFKLAEIFGTTVDLLIAPEEEAAPADAEPSDRLDQTEKARRSGRTRRIRMALITAGGYLAIFLFGRIFCSTAADRSVLGFLFGTDPKQSTYLFGWLLSSKLYGVASMISILPAVFGKYRFSFVTLAGFLLGLVFGELFGPNPAGEAYGMGHYGWAIWGAIFALSIVIGIILEKVHRPGSPFVARK